jgi:adenine-specific DNA-methyltransferase
LSSAQFGNGNKELLILDFFAGSGTTAHAVMRLNAEDGGQRRYILVQIPEEIAKAQEAYKAGFRTIDEITIERIKRAADKIKEEYGDTPAATDGSVVDYGFKHYRLAVVDYRNALDALERFDTSPDIILSEDMVEALSGRAILTLPDEARGHYTPDYAQASGLDVILATWLINDGYSFDMPVDIIEFGDAWYKAYMPRGSHMIYLIMEGWDLSCSKGLLNAIGRNELPLQTVVIYPYSFSFTQLLMLKNNLKTCLDTEHKIKFIERF